jgi:hypothetical protein
MKMSWGMTDTILAAYQPAPESPSPWIKITVAVCRLTAGMISGARYSILIKQIYFPIEYEEALDTKVRDLGPHFGF